MATEPVEMLASAGTERVALRVRMKTQIESVYSSHPEEE